MTLHQRLEDATEGTRGHTPGPWEARRDGTNIYQIVSRTYVVGVLHAHDHPGISGPANARLIAAAPDMFDALKEARENILYLKNARWSEAEGTDEEWVSGIDAAIAKATASPDTGEGG